LDEAVRFMRWQAYAPAFSIALGNSSVSRAEGADAWYFAENDTWYKQAKGKPDPQADAAAMAGGGGGMY
jgi:hypothetical protein